MHFNLTCLLSKLQSNNLEILATASEVKQNKNVPRGHDPFWHCLSEILEIIWIYISQVNYRTNPVLYNPLVSNSMVIQIHGIAQYFNNFIRWV